jgi:DNA-directed RNA polymerase specialized sigma24 family protein
MPGPDSTKRPLLDPTGASLRGASASLPGSGASLDDLGASFDDEDAPISEPRPSSPAADPSLLDMRGASNDVDAPLPPDNAVVPALDEGLPVTPELTKAFLAKKATRDRIKEVVECRAAYGARKMDLEDMIQDANVRAMTTTALARSVSTMRPWVSRIAQNVVIDFYRDGAKHLTWLKPGVDVQELPPDPGYDGEEGELPPPDPNEAPRPVQELDPRMLHGWLAANLKTKAERLTLEMIEQKAASEVSNADLAAEFGMTEAAFDNRLLRFKAKWIPRWEKHKRDQVWMVVVLVFVAAAAGVLWWQLGAKKSGDVIGPTEVPVLQPAPTATASAVQDEDAAPVPEKPERLKPR